MKRLLAAICLIASTCLAQSPGAKILVLERDQGEKRVRRSREKMPNPHPSLSSRSLLKTAARSILSLEQKRFLLVA